MSICVRHMDTDKKCLKHDKHRTVRFPVFYGKFYCNRLLNRIQHFTLWRFGEANNRCEKNSLPLILEYTSYSILSSKWELICIVISTGLRKMFPSTEPKCSLKKLIYIIHRLLPLFIRWHNKKHERLYIYVVVFSVCSELTPTVFSLS